MNITQCHLLSALLLLAVCSSAMACEDSTTSLLVKTPNCHLISVNGAVVVNEITSKNSVYKFNFSAASQATWLKLGEICNFLPDDVTTFKSAVKENKSVTYETEEEFKKRFTDPERCSVERKGLWTLHKNCYVAKCQ